MMVLEAIKYEQKNITKKNQGKWRKYILQPYPLNKGFTRIKCFGFILIVWRNKIIYEIKKNPSNKTKFCLFDCLFDDLSLTIWIVSKKLRQNLRKKNLRRSWQNRKKKEKVMRKILLS